MPAAEEEPGEELDGADEEEAEEAGDEGDGEDFGDFAHAAIHDDEVAEGVGFGAGEELAGDGADGREGGGDFHASEEMRQRGGEAQEEDFLGTGGIIDGEEVEEAAVGGGEAKGGAGDDGEEGDDERGQGDADRAGAEPDHENGDEHDDGNHLQGEHPGVEGGFDPAGGGEDEREERAAEDGGGKTNKSRAAGVQGGGKKEGTFTHEGVEDIERRSQAVGRNGENDDGGLPEREEDDSGEEWRKPEGDVGGARFHREDSVRGDGETR